MNTNILDPEIIAEAQDLLGERYAQSTARFTEQGRDRLARIKSEIEGHGDPEVVAFEAHSLKSSSACLGAVEFPVRVGELEIAARALKKGESPATLKNLFEAAQRSFDNLTAAFIGMRTF
jgi:HPt (histidine-containing phosphotransfer) domain-containing protein